MARRIVPLTAPPPTRQRRSGLGGDRHRRGSRDGPVRAVRAVSVEAVSLARERRDSFRPWLGIDRQKPDSLARERRDSFRPWLGIDRQKMGPIS